jgi:diguanylate cyclase (GGDEF)-like protein
MDIVKDMLTGFYSEKFFKEGMIDGEILRAERYGNSLTFVLFKYEIPQKYHMEMYFPILKRIGKEIINQTRKIDIRVRMGDRILLVLPETNEAGARTAAQKVAATIKGIEFYHDVTQEYFHIEVEWSVALFPRDGDTKEAIYETLVQNLEGMEEVENGEATPVSEEETKEAAG